MYRFYTSTSTSRNRIVYTEIVKSMKIHELYILYYIPTRNTGLRTLRVGAQYLCTVVSYYISVEYSSTPVLSKLLSINSVYAKHIRQIYDLRVHTEKD